MNSESFFDVAESLRLYRRAEIKPKGNGNKSNPLDKLYVDPLSSDGVLKTVMSDNTVFLIGRKGTGKSTIFAKAISNLSKENDVVSIYVDVKSIYDLISSGAYHDPKELSSEVSSEVYATHMVRVAILTDILGKLIDEFTKEIGKLGFWQSFVLNKKEKITKAISKLKTCLSHVNEGGFDCLVLPTLKKVSYTIKEANQNEGSLATKLNGSLTTKVSGEASCSQTDGKSGANVKVGGESGLSLTSELSQFKKAMSSGEVYEEYSETLVRRYPFQEIISEIQTILDDAGMKKLFIFLDDFSEIDRLDQQLFVDVILSTLNNASNEYIKLKIAGYPGRVYYGGIDPGKVTNITIDFYDIYESVETQAIEDKACRYTKDLLEKRFDYYGVVVEDFFDLSAISMDDYFKLFFKVSFNVPRIVGYILYELYKDRITHGDKINAKSIELAAKKYYETTIVAYFNTLSKYAKEPFESKVDRDLQKRLMDFIVKLSKDNKAGIRKGQIGGTYFSGLNVISSSHFVVADELTDVMSSLEANFIVSRYKKIRNKESKTVFVYALFYGLCVSERIDWGYPEGRKYRAYFQQRCFDYSARIHQFLSSKRSFVCTECGHVMPDDKDTVAKLEYYNFLCNRCMKGTMKKQSVVSKQLSACLSDCANEDITLERIELDILSALYQSGQQIAAAELAGLLDTNQQLIGKRTKKLRELGLVQQSKYGGKTMNSLTASAIELYFS